MYCFWAMEALCFENSIIICCRSVDRKTGNRSNTILKCYQPICNFPLKAKYGYSIFSGFCADQKTDFEFQEASPKASDNIDW